MNEQNNRRNGIAIMRSLIGLIKPLIPIMIFAILLGVLEYLCAISLTILAGFGLIHSSLMLAGSTMDAAVLEAFASHHFTRMAAGMVLIAVLRGLLHYGEQYCNHFIAFKLLAMIRGKVFGTLRILCPAKLEGKGKGNVDIQQVVLVTLGMMGSFGPVVALSNLSNNLTQTLASGERVLSLLEEEPEVMEVTGRDSVSFEGAKADQVTFAYEDEEILRDVSLEFPKGKVVGIHGASGCGKSTLLKLLMRFWDLQKGTIRISDRDAKEVNTENLRNMESYVTQETYLFHDSIANNIAVGKVDATREEIMEAAKRASIHDFIMTLPKGYDTEVGELGDTLSGGEKQRIGLARAFLHNAPFLLLDEPTSNLDALNEGIILKSLQDSCKDKTVVLVSHRKSTMNLADVVYEMGQERDC